jgi:hypothetical protein
MRGIFALQYFSGITHLLWKYELQNIGGLLPQTSSLSLEGEGWGEGGIAAIHGCFPFPLIKGRVERIMAECN